MLSAMLIGVDRSMAQIYFKFLLYAAVSRKSGGKNLPVTELGRNHINDTALDVAGHQAADSVSE